jgi:hypothetical protein
LWKDNQAENIASKFEAEGGKVEYVTGSPAANFAKLIAARGKAPFDVVKFLLLKSRTTTNLRYFMN